MAGGDQFQLCATPLVVESLHSQAGDVAVLGEEPVRCPIGTMSCSGRSQIASTVGNPNLRGRQVYTSACQT